MLVIRKKVINDLITKHGESNMIGAFAEARDFTIIDRQTILMINDNKMISITISKLYNEVKKVEVFNRRDIKYMKISKSIMSTKLAIETDTFKGTFLIKNKISTLGEMQKEFLHKLDLFANMFNEGQ
ncbi:hypothetical protein [Metaclostridioides mangenotii]|jgi:hypothetical protein|uniref:PH domain-containing protein n=1 Tax=Metaclostridioides mangenotii TaxID=1540 RepID=A0ABS4E6X3_9FIRM|nr:hypothetical protein [Clostridioides mangenotii]MBP1853669.1 hypothetical protein [Clostridioides mangenotii]